MNVAAVQETYTYTSSSKLASVDGARTDVSDIELYHYDTDNNLSEIVNALAHSVKFQNYNLSGKAQTIIDANNVSTQLTYDRKNRITSTNMDGRVTQFQYNNYGLLTLVALPYGDTITFSYDDARRLIKILNGNNDAVEYNYNSKGNITKTQVILSNGSVVREANSTYDELGRLLSLNTGAFIFQYSYDKNSNQSEERVGGKEEKSEYDEFNRLTTITDALLGITQLEYNDQDVLVSVLDARNNATQYSPDFQGNIVELNSHDTGVSQMQYDAASNLISKVDARGVLIQYSYDALNRLILIDSPVDDYDFTYEYDNAESSRFGIGKLTTISNSFSTIDYFYNQYGEVTKTLHIIEGKVYQILYGYLNGLLTKVTYPNGREILYSYNAQAQIVNVHSLYEGKTIELANDIAYLPQGPIKSMSYGNGKLLTKNYDTSFSMTNQAVTGVFDYGITYDNAANIQSIIDNLAPHESKTYNYDNKNRLTSVTVNNIEAQSFSYDSTDNRLSKTDSTGVKTYTYLGNTLSIVDGLLYQFDNNGNLIQKDNETFTYSPLNRYVTLTKSTDSISYKYNALGQRVLKSSTDSNYHFLYDLAGQLIYEIDTISNKETEYSYLNGKRLSLHSKSLSSDDLIKDDDDVSTTITGKWKLVAKGRKPYYGAGYIKSVKGSGENTVEWPLTNTLPGQYQIYTRWIRKRKNASNAPYTINHALGQDTVLVNQKRKGSKWRLLGTFDLNPQSNISLSNDANGFVIADAIKVVPLDGATISTSYNYYIHTNQVDAPLAITNSYGDIVWKSNYTPFGIAELNEDVDGNGELVEYNLRFPGQYYDKESGLHYNYFRDYDPELGRYIQSDPIGLAGGINTYGYVGGNPISYFDPYGLAKICYRPLDSVVLRNFVIGVKGSPADRKNMIIGHQQIFYEDAQGGDIGFGPDGLIINENRESEYSQCTDGYDDKKMREAVKMTPVSDYKFFKNNCQDWVRDVLDNYGK